ncbi:hypothetical protein [Psychroserpens algicola]|uniref:Uncharacterized protein n=1 Tax=Psychroserpens algicola TaxID=1719034 RepID=A0ABT0HCY8_9FLAO|nr:hypothetical protein [Psychroserpens algicola]MCK8482228.1 hypothetical protein [Psychroserpens algicola]
MKKKHLNILLFILVLVIYGGVFLKLFGKKEVQLNDSFINTTFTKQVSGSEIKRNDFDISTIKSDPFGISKRRNKKQVETTKTKNTAFSSSKKTELIKPWPKVTYYGFVKNNSNKTKLVLVKVNSKLYRKREQETIDDIRIVKAYNDSIILSKDNETKTIKKVNE